MRMTVRSSRLDGRRLRLAGLGTAAALLATAGVVAGWQPPAEAASHPRLGGLQIVFGIVRNPSPVKTLTVRCPPGKRVLGGGGRILDGSPVTLTRLQPYQQSQNADDQRGYGFRADAAVLTGGADPDWALEAWAYCANANSVPGVHIMIYSSDFSSAPVQAVPAPCLDGEHVLGTGARAEPYYYGDQYQRGLGLQVARVDKLGLLARAQAHEQPDGYPYDWRIQAIAVCIPNTPVGYEVFMKPSRQSDSESFKDAYGSCPALPDDLPRKPISVGGAVSNVAPGDATLMGTGSSGGTGDFNEVFAYAVENTPTSLAWDFIVVSYVCALFGTYER